MALIKSIPVVPNAAAIELVEHLMERIKSGRIIGVAVCTVDRGGESHQAWCTGDFPKYTMLAAIEILKRDYMANEIE